MAILGRIGSIAGQSGALSLDAFSYLARFQAEDLALSDLDPVTTWADTSGNGEDVTQATSTKKPTFHSAGYVSFDGGDWLQNTTFSRSQPFTFYVVVNVSAVDQIQTVIGDTDAYMGFTDVGPGRPWAYSNVLTLSQSADRRGSKIILSATFNGGSSKLNVNGVQVDSGTLNPVSLSGFFIGAKAVDTYMATMDLWSAFITSSSYDSDLNDAINSAYSVY